MKTILSVAIILCGLCSFVPPAEGPSVFHIVYIDNSRATSEDGLNDMIFTRLMEQFDSIRANKNARFLFFVSNGRNYTVTENVKSIDKMMEQAFLSNPQKTPDQTFDANKLRDYLNSNFSGFTGSSVVFTLCVSENMAHSFSDSYSPLISTLPQEIASAYGKKNVKVNLYYPKLTGRIREDAIAKNITFYNTGEFFKSIDVNIKGL